MVEEGDAERWGEKQRSGLSTGHNGKALTTSCEALTKGVK